MSYKHYNEVVDAELPFDSSMQRFIFLESCYRSDNRGIIRSPQAQLASYFLLSRQTIAREFTRLQEHGLLEKIGYGRYQVVIPATGKESLAPRPTPLRAKLLRWLRDNWGDETAKEGEEITIIEDDDLLDIPDFFDEAVSEGYLEQLMQGNREGRLATQYKVHLNPTNSFDSGVINYELEV